MYYRYSTALSHLVLVVVSAYCLKNYNVQIAGYYPVVSYVIVLINSLCGIWKWGNPANGPMSNTIYNYTRFLQTICTLPCIVAELWMKNSPELAYTHLLGSLLLWFSFYVHNFKDKLVDIIIALNIFSCVFISVAVENWYGITLAFSYAINHFILHEGCEIFEMPTIDFHNYAMCFFLSFSLKAFQACYI